MKSIPMNIDNLDYQLGYIRSDEAGKFMAFLVNQDVTGAINGCSQGTISLKEIIDYVEKKTGAKAILDKDGDAAPYNGEPEYSINTEKAKQCKKAEASLYLFKYIDCPAVLLECGFLSNAEETVKLKDSSYQKEMALIIASGFLDHTRDAVARESVNEDTVS